MFCENCGIWIDGEEATICDECYQSLAGQTEEVSPAPNVNELSFFCRGCKYKRIICRYQACPALLEIRKRHRREKLNEMVNKRAWTCECGHLEEKHEHFSGSFYVSRCSVKKCKCKAFKKQNMTPENKEKSGDPFLQDWERKDYPILKEMMQKFGCGRVMQLASEQWRLNLQHDPELLKGVLIPALPPKNLPALSPGNPPAPGMFSAEDCARHYSLGVERGRRDGEKILLKSCEKCDHRGEQHPLSTCEACTRNPDFSDHYKEMNVKNEQGN